MLPLYGRLTGPEQDKVFAGHTRRRVVLATNVAETSLTIPGVRFVIDAGLARVSRYSPRAKFQRLPIEPVSQASADQRRGRCGREGEGICIRLYAEDDYLARPRYTEPELLRTNLASLVLQMAALGLGDPQDFPFLDAPDARLLNDGYRLLQELNAVDGDRRITRLGRQMAALPVDPRLARVLVESGRTACVDEALVLVSFLSIQDPRERPAEKAEAADAKHAQFADDRSDFIGVLNLWAASRDPAAGGNRVLRHWCRENFLSFVRMREWADLREQLAEMSRSIVKVRGDKTAPPGMGILHQTLLTGFLGGIGVLDEARTYLGARDTRFVIAPGTPLQKRSPHWIVAASLVETHRLYARMVAQVQPSWIEAAGAHLVKRTYGEAEWDAQRGMAFAKETVSLYGRVLSSGRRVSFADGRSASPRNACSSRKRWCGASRHAVCVSRSQRGHPGPARAGRVLPAPPRPARRRGRARALLPRAHPAARSLRRARSRNGGAVERDQAACARRGRIRVPAAAAARRACQRLPVDVRRAGQRTAPALSLRHRRRG